jgi:hypothetical protein
MKTITVRTLRRGQPEDTLSPGEALRVTKAGGKTFELRRTDEAPRSRLAGLREAMQEVPNAGGPGTDVAAWCREEDL